jgi:zinc transporter ZupT
MTALLVATLAGVGFSGAALLALLSRGASSASQTYATAAAAGILLAVAFGDIFPESLEMAGAAAAVGFLAGFAMMFLSETLTHSHAHPSEDEHSHKHSLGQFILGLSVHNLSDGFVIGVSATAASAAAVDLGVLVHQVPVGGALAAVLVAAQVTRAHMIRTAVALGAAIPAGAAITTVALPTLGEGASGVMLGVAGGVLTYVSAAHLLPEVQSERPSRFTGITFVAALALTTLGLYTFLGD